MSGMALLVDVFLVNSISPSVYASQHTGASPGRSCLVGRREQALHLGLIEQLPVSQFLGRHAVANCAKVENLEYGKEVSHARTTQHKWNIAMAHSPRHRLGCPAALLPRTAARRT